MSKFFTKTSDDYTLIRFPTFFVIVNHIDTRYTSIMFLPFIILLCDHKLTHTLQWLCCTSTFHMSSHLVFITNKCLENVCHSLLPTYTFISNWINYMRTHELQSYHDTYHAIHSSFGLTFTRESSNLECILILNKVYFNERTLWTTLVSGKKLYSARWLFIWRKRV